MLQLFLLILNIKNDKFKKVENVTWVEYMNHVKSRYYKPITTFKEIEKLISVVGEHPEKGWVGVIWFDKFEWIDDVNDDYFIYLNNIYFDNGTINHPFYQCYYDIGNGDTIFENCYNKRFGYLIEQDNEDHPSNCNDINDFCLNIRSIKYNDIINCTTRDNKVKLAICDYDYRQELQFIILEKKDRKKYLKKINNFFDSIVEKTNLSTENQTKTVLKKIDHYMTESHTLSENEVQNISIKFLKSVTNTLFLNENENKTNKYNFSNFYAKLVTINDENIENVLEHDNPNFNIKLNYNDVKKIANKNDNVKLSVIYWKDERFIKLINEKEKILSKVVEISLNQESVTDLKMEIIFKGEFNDTSKCGYLDLASKNWMTTYCNTKFITNGITCECSHLTNFAILFNPNIKGPKWISIFTNVGLGISIIAELAVIIYSIISWEKGNKSYSFNIFLNLCISMLLMNLVFAFGTEYGKNKSCGAVGFLLHYFLLCAFAWMTVEGSFFYYLFVRVLGNIPYNFNRNSLILAWGLPLIPPITITAINWKFYIQNQICWLDDLPLYLGVYLPVALCLLINILIIIIIHLNLTKNRKRSRLYSKSSFNKSREYFMSFGLIFFFGLTWILGFLMKLADSLTLQFIFVLLNSLQGFYLFLLRFFAHKFQSKL